MTQLLQMSLQGTVLIAAVLVLRALFARRMAPTVLYALWLIPAARLLIPGSVESVFSLQNLISPAAEEQAVAVIRQGALPMPLPMQSTEVVTAGGEVQSVSTAGTLFLDVGALLVILWLAGAAAVLLAAVWKNAAFFRRVRKGAVPVAADCPLPVYLSEHLSSPCLCGFFSPVIFVCDQTLQSQAHLDMALRHELSHYRARDRFWALLRLACCAVHWFNPMVWVAARCSVQDCERACDHRVLKNADQDEREAYGALLLSYIRRGVERNSVFCTFSPMGGGKRALRERIALIGRRPVTKKIAVAALAVCVALTCLVACTSRTGGEAYQQFAAFAAADNREILVSEGQLDSGRTLANYLESRDWTAVELPETQPDQLEEQLLIRVQDTQSDRLGTLSVFRAVENGAYYARIDMTAADGTVTADIWYELSEEEMRWLWALAQISNSEITLRAAIPDGGEMAMVCAGPAMGSEWHYFFYSENGTDYVPVEGNLDDQYARVAESMLFVSRDVGFVSFRFEEINGLHAPNLYRTADGGRTWARVELPMGDITTGSGYSGMHVTDMTFEDASNGSVTMGMHYNGTEGSLSCVFTTTDGGETWSAVSTQPMQSGVTVSLYVSNDSADGLLRTTAELPALTAENVTAALVSAAVLPEQTTVRAFSADGDHLSLDLSQEFAAGVRRSGTAGETMILSSLTNTFLEAFGASSLTLTVEGAPLETGRNVYDAPLTWYDNVMTQDGGAAETNARLATNELRLNSGNTYSLHLIGSDPSPTANWVSSDSSIVSVDDVGIVTAHRRGSATITAQWNGSRQDSCTVQVLDPMADAVDETARSFSYDAVRREMTFTTASYFDAPENLSIHISGRQEMDAGQFMSRHFLENTAFVGGQTYTFQIGSSAYEELSATISYEEGARTYEHTVDLLALL